MRRGPRRSCQALYGCRACGSPRVFLHGCQKGVGVSALHFLEQRAVVVAVQGSHTHTTKGVTGGDTKHVSAITRNTTNQPQPDVQLERRERADTGLADDSATFITVHLLNAGTSRTHACTR